MSVVLGRNEAGNALWLILLGIALLAGLTALVTRTGSQSDDTGSNERAAISASEIMRYGGEIRNAITRLRGTGCSDNEISFENSYQPGRYINPNSPADKSCHVFDANGGGVQWKKASAYITNPLSPTAGEYVYSTAYSNSNPIRGFGTDSRSDLYLAIGYADSFANWPNFLRVCKKINSMNGVAVNSAHVYGLPQFGLNTGPDANGTFTDNIASGATSLGSQLKNTPAFCIYFNSLTEAFIMIPVMMR